MTTDVRITNITMYQNIHQLVKGKTYECEMNNVKHETLKDSQNNNRNETLIRRPGRVSKLAYLRRIWKAPL